MDNAAIKERNFRTVNLLRQRNQREQRRLDEKVNSKQGLRDNYLTEVNAVSKEQYRIKQELSKIRKTITTTWGILPPRGGPGEETSEQEHHRISQLEAMFKAGKQTQSHNHNKGHGHEKHPLDHKQKMIETLEKQDAQAEETAEKILTPPNSASSKSSEKTEEKPPPPPDILVPSEEAAQSTTPKTKTTNNISIAVVNVDNAKDNIAKRLTSTEKNKDQEKSVKPKSTIKGKPLLKPATLELGAAAQPRFLTPIDEQQQEEAHAAAKAETEQAEDKNSQQKSKEKQPGKNPKKKLVRKNSKQEIEKVEFDQNKYNADGSLRMVHKMPDADARFTEAKKARYIRHKGQVQSEKELSVNEIFAQEKKKDGLKSKKQLP